MSENKVVTRFAPSPTGYLHIGGVRTALFSYLYAKQHGGEFVLRIEDTDKERSKPEYEEDIIRCFDWLKFDYGNVIYKQSEREHIYQSYLAKLVKSGAAYISKEQGGVDEDGKLLRGEVIRFKNPNTRIIFNDIIRGQVEFDTADLGDFVIAKSLTEPLYHLAVIIDDHEMGITHVIRGEEHLSNTPRQILMLEALGIPRPTYAHLPIILDADRAKLSKRKHGEKVWLRNYIKEGYLREAIINFLALLGWNPGTDQELFTIDELIREFNLSKVQKSGAIFNDEKLRWFNKQYIQKMPKEELYARIREIFGQELSGELLEKFAPIVVERISTFGELKIMKETGEFEYVFKAPEYPKESLLFKGKGEFSALKKHLEKVIHALRSIQEEDFKAEYVKHAIWDYASEVGRGDVLWPMRYALSGKEKSPDPFVLSELLGKKETLKRLEEAHKMVS